MFCIQIYKLSEYFRIFELPKEILNIIPEKANFKFSNFIFFKKVKRLKDFITIDISLKELIEYDWNKDMYYKIYLSESDKNIIYSHYKLFISEYHTKKLFEYSSDELEIRYFRIKDCISRYKKSKDYYFELKVLGHYIPDMVNYDIEIIDDQLTITKLHDYKKSYIYLDEYLKITLRNSIIENDAYIGINNIIHDIIKPLV